MRTVSDFLKEQGCLFIKVVKDNKIYFCEFIPQTIMWYGKPVDVGVHFKDTCIVTELDETTVVDYSAKRPFDNLNEETGYYDVNLWEECHNTTDAGDYIDWEAREEWLKACEEE